LIACEHFIYAMFPKQGYKLIKSRGLSTHVSTDNLYFLRSLGNNIYEETCLQVYFPKERVFAVSYLKPTTDTYGRRGVWNHTIIVPSNDLTTLLE